MRTRFLSLLFLLLSSLFFAQESEPFYATMALHQAYALQSEMPSETAIIDRSGNQAVVSMTWKAARLLREKVVLHGPGFIYRATLADALSALSPTNIKNSRIAFTIDQDAVVNQVIDLIDLQNLEDHIIELEDYGTRFHDRSQAQQAAIELKARWEAMAAQYGRTDVSVRLYDHVSTPMPSVIMTIEGSQFPEEFVIVGGHLDSTSNQGNNDAPGADDNASGVATITEATRALFEVGFVPTRTVEVMAYAAEEIGLVGSNEIAQEYSANGINVLACVQFDMTNYQGSGEDVYFVTDYTAASLNDYLMSLMDHYNSTGEHSFSYGTTLCNYGCSDHASWHNQGYQAAFPFESSFGQHNPNIHSPFDTFAFMATAEHAAKFSKLCAEFIIETAKNDEQLGVRETGPGDYDIYVHNRQLAYRFGPGYPVSTVRLYDLTGNLVLSQGIHSHSGAIDLSRLHASIYLAVFTTADGRLITQKVPVH